MKRCPSCNRTFSDETISFCLADGSLLSASYERSKENPPATEILPVSNSAVPPTERAHGPADTITSFRLHQPDEKDDSPSGSQFRSRSFFYALGALLGVAIIAGVILFILNTLNAQPPKSADKPQETVTNNSPSPIDSQVASVTPSLEVRNSPAINQEPRTVGLGGGGGGGNPASSPRLTPSSEMDYTGIFSGGEVSSKARVLEKPEPIYTEGARRNQVTGTVVLRAVFASNGQVTNIHVVSGLPDGLTERAIEAAKKIRFTPATKDGHPVSMWMELQYNFNLY